MAERNKPPSFSMMADKIKKERPRMVAIEAKKFFKESFVKGGWTDRAYQPWVKRTSPLGGKKILIGGAGANTMNLMQSIRTLEESDSRVRTGTDLIYSEIHNEGGTITVTAKMKKFWWAKYYEFAKKTKTNKDGKSMRITKANREFGTKAEFCKAMALMKIGKKIKIPKRQYLGESATLMKQFEEWFTGEIEKLK